MPNVAENAFYAHLTDPDSLDYIVREGFTLEAVRDVIPTEVGRDLTAWAIDYYFDNGRKVAPTKEAIEATWGDKLQPLEIEIHDDVETDSIQWAISQMRSDFADYMAGEFATAMIKEVRAANGPDRAGVVLEHSQLLHAFSQSLISRRNEMDGYEGLSDAVKRYEERAEEGHKFKGVTFGIPEIDNHTMGVHPGEMCVFTATSGGGKSWLSIVVLLQEFQRGRKGILFTLENDVEMTYDRIACVHCRVDYEKWQRGEVDEGDLARVKAFVQQMEDAPNRPIIIQPDLSESTGAAMVRRAIIEGCDSIIIDQLSHIESVAGSKARQRNEIVGETIKDLYKLINNPGYKLPLILLAQINRKGRDEARKVGRYLMDHLGEATQVENAADFIFALYQGPDHEIAELAEIQQLKGRRVKKMRGWEVTWRPALGDVRFKREVDDD